MECVVSMQPKSWPEPSEEIVTAVEAMYRRRGQELPLPVVIRDELGELFADSEFAEAFGTRGKPGWSPGRLALVTALQKAESLTDRAAAEAVRLRVDWKYCLGMSLDDAGFDASVLCEFRSRVASHGLEEKALDLLLAALQEKGLLVSGGKQRTDSTHVISAVRDLNRLELAGETVRAALEVLAVAVPDWLADVIDISEWNERYGVRIDSWRLPASQAKRDRLVQVYGQDAVALLRAVYAEQSPDWLAEVPAVETLRIVLLQNYYLSTDTQGREVIQRREADEHGLPPAHRRVSSPYDTDARWAAKGEETFWLGYKVHVTETCDDDTSDNTESTITDGVDDTQEKGPKDHERPNLITNVATTPATVPDVAMTAPIHEMLTARGLTPAEHYVDSGYPSAALTLSSRQNHGIELVSPLLADTSPQARAGEGFDRASFEIDFAARQATCPQGHTSSWWNSVTQRGTEAIVVKFAAATCRACPVRDQCTSSTRSGRQLTIPPHAIYETQRAGRAEQDTHPWKQRYAIRAGAEGTIRQGIAVTGLRRSRYRGLGKTHLDHVYQAVALNLIRLHAHWTGHPLDRRRTSHLSRLEFALAA
jgi:IS5 family transposase